jgi:hypothetical protein
MSTALSEDPRKFLESAERCMEFIRLCHPVPDEFAHLVRFVTYHLRDNAKRAEGQGDEQIAQEMRQAADGYDAEAAARRKG